VTRFDYKRPLAHSDDPAGFAQHNLDKSRIGAERSRPSLRQRRRYDVAQSHDTPFGLRKNLLREDNNVAGLDPGSLALCPVPHDPRDVFARPHFRQRPQTDQLDSAPYLPAGTRLRHFAGPMPVIRMPDPKTL
jgi:hypothetical protein